MRTSLKLVLSSLASSLILSLGATAANAQVAYVTGNYYTVPYESFRQTCVVSYEDASIVQAQCRAFNGYFYANSFVKTGCYGDIFNNNGAIQCNRQVIGGPLYVFGGLINALGGFDRRDDRRDDRGGYGRGGDYGRGGYDHGGDYGRGNDHRNDHGNDRGHDNDHGRPNPGSGQGGGNHGGGQGGGNHGGGQGGGNHGGGQGGGRGGRH